jgi:hypothetical protein
VRHRERLLQIDVLPREAGGDRHFGVPVVRQADHHGVDVLAGEQLAIVAVLVDRRLGRLLRGEKFFHLGLAARHPAGVEIAHRDDVREAGRRDARHVVRLADAAAADVGDADAVAGRIRPEEARGNDERCDGGGYGSGADEIAAAEVGREHGAE